MKRLKKALLILASSFLLFGISFWIYSIIIANSIDKIVLIKVAPLNIGQKNDSILLDKSNCSAFVRDYKIKHPLVFVKFCSNYVIKIYYKNGETESFRTNGHMMEILYSPKNKRNKTFAFMMSPNIITKYWKVSENIPCDEFFILSLYNFKGYKL
jgi:hypothetical protein